MFATTCSKSRTTSAGAASFSTGRRARSESIASRACGRARGSVPSLWEPSDESGDSVWTRASESWARVRPPSRRAPRWGRHDRAQLEVDQPVREAVADRPPQVLLDQPARRIEERLALVEGARDAGAERIHERGERLRLGEVRLRVADANLDGRER